MNIITTEQKPIKCWATNLDENALEQAKHLSNLPFAFSHVALMPDSHLGMGMPIGGVLATENVIIPNAVGVDIGCGMCALKTSLRDLDKTAVRSIIDKIYETIPVGFNHHKERQNINWVPAIDYNNNSRQLVIQEDIESLFYQVGTLGGGNHFIEVQKDESGFIWIMIHSGSRNLGKRVGDYYNKQAQYWNDKWCSAVPKEWQLAFLPSDSEDGMSYLSEMQYCVEFALNNRRLMMYNIRHILIDLFKEVQFGDLINIAHNYVKLEHHFGRNVWVHRKGATLADKNTIGIIPGSQGSNSYIVKGLGNPQSFNSCSHGAGRKLGRKVAQKTLDLNSERNKLDKMGIVHKLLTVADLDESAGAYKDINEVMENQKDLVEIKVKLTPLGVVKG